MPPTSRNAGLQQPATRLRWSPRPRGRRTSRCLWSHELGLTNSSSWSSTRCPESAGKGSPMKAIDELPFEWIRQGPACREVHRFSGCWCCWISLGDQRQDDQARPQCLGLGVGKGVDVSAIPNHSRRGRRQRRRSPGAILRATLDCENLKPVSSWVEHGLGDRSRLEEKLREHWRTTTNRCLTTLCTNCWPGSRSSDRWQS